MKSPPAAPNCRSFAMAAAKPSKSRCGSVGITAPVASGRCSAICIPRFWRPISIQQNLSPRVPSMSFPGKVRRRACGQHTSESKNARKRGRSCPEAWVFLVPERVCPKVEANPHKSQLSRSGEEDWKRGRTVRTPAAWARGAFSTLHQTFKSSKYFSPSQSGKHMLELAPSMIDADTFHADVRYIESLWQRVAVGGIDMPVIDIGSDKAEPLVFVPILEHLEFVYARQIRAFSQSRRVIMYRRRETHTHPVGLVERSEELKQVFEFFGFEFFDLVGHGDAAMVLFEF